MAVLLSSLAKPKSKGLVDFKEKELFVQAILDHLLRCVDGYILRPPKLYTYKCIVFYIYKERERELLMRDFSFY